MDAFIDRYIDGVQNEMISELQKLVRFPSVKAPSAGVGMPFGRPLAEALDYAMELGGRLGFETDNVDGYAGSISFGEGSETLGILCHLDVVPEGTGWKHPPYEGTVEGGRIYGRGTSDDKGPAICALYAMAAVKAAKLPLKRRVQLILGCDEESGSECMAHYNKHRHVPEIAFSPDAEYPVVYSEKGMIRFTLTKKYASGITLAAGERANVVPNKAVAAISLDADAINPRARAFAARTGFGVEVEAADGGSLVTVTGVAAHASTPNMGKNAIQAMLWLLNELKLPGEDGKAVAALHELVQMDMYAQNLGLSCEDETGNLTMNVGVVEWNSEGLHKLMFDLRCPRSMDFAKAKESIVSQFNAAGFEVAVFETVRPHYIPVDSELVSCLKRVYNERTGTNAEPISIGGGTYARSFPCAVGFGCERPGFEATMHMPNEYFTVEDLLFNAKVIADAIIALAVE